ncbi:MAG: DMT family transporter [Candidatus Moraniibacteriota bacterium]
MISENKKGELMIYAEVLLWAFFPIVTVFSFVTMPSLLSLAWSSVFACLFFIPIMAYQKRWGEMKNILLFQYVLGITLFNGVSFYVLYFTALKYTTPGNAAIISLLEILTTFIFFNVVLSEKISKEYVVGACFMLLGALVVLTPNFVGINIGDFLILAATIIAPVGNFLQQRARKLASGETIIFLRNLTAIPAIFFLAYVFGQRASFLDIQWSFLFLLINGVLFFGLSKLLWLEGIHRMSVTKAMAMQGIVPIITLCAAWVFLDQEPTIWQLLSLAPLSIGLLLLTDQLRFTKK